ncbi:MAG: glycosyltransferase family A protein [Candidatus Thorarchaeota archaeon]
MGEYVLLTKFWNERERIPAAVRRIAQQTKKPVVWLLIDDGSTDGGGQLFRHLAEGFGIQSLLIQLPPKKVGNLDTLGRAYTYAFRKCRGSLDKLRPDYLALLDVDTRLPRNYYERIIALLDSNPALGVAAGTIEGEKSPPTWPRGSGKVVRWKVVKSIDKYWDIDADSLYNIKALRLGYQLMVDYSLKISASPSAVFTKQGRFRFGRLSYYIGKNPLLVLQMALALQLKKDYGAEYLRGYVQEWSRGTWRCSDSDVRYFYSLEYRIREKLRRAGLGNHSWPR